MKVQAGNIELGLVKDQNIKNYTTKTHKYLLPYLKEYGSEFSDKLSKVFKVAVGLGDIIKTKTGIKYEKHLFILIDTRIAPKFFIEFIVWIKDQHMYEDDYVFGDIPTSPFHMVVIKFPESLLPVLGYFKKGEYSEFSKISDINKYFKNHPETLKVIIKDSNYRVTFTKEVNKLYGTVCEPEEFIAELDFSPKPKEEIFNHHLKK